MDGRKSAVVATAGAVTVLAVVLAVVRWDDANKIASSVSALAGIAAVGVGVWAALRGTADGGNPSGTRGGSLHVSRTGRAVAGRGSRANTGVTGSGDALPAEVRVEHTGDAEASDEGEADSGIRLS